MTLKPNADELALIAQERGREVTRRAAPYLSGDRAME